MQHRACMSLLLLLALAARSGLALTGSCVAELACVASDACPPALKAGSTDLPFTLGYTRTASLNTTTFVFGVCTQPDQATPATSSPLAAVFLRLSDAVLAKPESIVVSNPPGQLVLGCASYGMPGYLWSGGNLLALADHDPASGAACTRFSVTLASTAPLGLAQAFQQDVKLANAAGKVVFAEGDNGGASAFYTLTLANNVGGFGLINSSIVIPAGTKFATTDSADSPAPASLAAPAMPLPTGAAPASPMSARASPVSTPLGPLSPGATYGPSRNLYSQNP